MIEAKTIFNSEHTKKMWSNIGIKKMGRGFEIFNSDFVNLGIEDKKISKIPKQDKHDVFTWIYAGNSLMSFKDHKKFLLVFDRMYSLGNEFNVKMYLSTFFLDKIDISKYPWLTINPSLTQEEFWIEASRCHAFLSTSKDETYGIAYWELMEIGRCV